MFAVGQTTLQVDAPVPAKQAAEERRGSRFVRSCFSNAELERLLMGDQPEEDSAPALLPPFLQKAGACGRRYNWETRGAVF